MDLLAKTVLAFCIGVGAMMGIQTLYMRSITDLIRADAGRPSAALPQMTPAFSVDASKMGAIIPKAPEIDTSAGQRATIQSMGRQIDQQIRGAQVPVPRNYPGMPRY
jgi:hypothetical protein